MLSSPRLRFLVKALHVCLELVTVDAPDASAADLDRRQLPGPNQRIDLRNAHAQVGRDVLERQESGLDLGTRLLCRRLTWHEARITRDDDGYMDLALFAAI